MKRLAIVTCAAALGVFATATVADAAPPEVGRKPCDAQDGILSNDQGTKTCTTVSPYTEVDKGTGIVGQVPSAYLRGDYHVVLTLQITTTQSERGNGEVTTTSDVQVLSREIVKDDCLFITGDTTQSWPISTCDQYGVYPPN